MLFDATFRDQVYANPAAVLREVELTSEERQWVVTPPPQAYGADVHRRHRALSGLLEEYPVAGALAARCCQGFDRLQGFFASASFHQCVQNRGSMATAFGDYLQSGVFVADSEVAHMAMVELGIVQVRRTRSSLPPPVHLYGEDTVIRLAPWVVLLAVPPATLPRYSTLLHHLRQHEGGLLEAILDTAYQLPSETSVRHAGAEWVLIVGDHGGDGPSLEAASEELGALLVAAQKAMTFGDLCAVAVHLGATPGEAVEIIEGFLADGLLIAGEPCPG
jgi:hypothetical protein